MTYSLRDVVQQPITPDELYRLVNDPNGQQRGPITRLGAGLVLGHDPVRLAENLADNPQTRTEGATVYGVPGDPSTTGVLAWLDEQGVPATLENVAARPLSAAEIWDLLKLPDSTVRVPYTLIDDAVVMGNDRGRLARVLAERGYAGGPPSSE